MKLSEYKSEYYEYSEKASDVARTAAFAGIALVWVFKIDGQPIPKLPKELLLPTALFALAIGCDLFQYITATAIWGCFHRLHERTLCSPLDDPDLHHSPWLPRAIIVFFILKLASVVAGYVTAITFVVQQWLSAPQ